MTSTPQTLQQPQARVRFWHYFGGLTLFIALMQALSGIFLALFYQATPERAYASVFYISHYVRYGWLIRSVHAWGATLMMCFVLVHLLRAFATASYKRPRQLTWVTGTALLGLTTLFAITGSLLQWDQRGYWASRSMLKALDALPLAGRFLSGLLAGGTHIDAAALTRFYAAHIILLPAALTVTLVLHFRLVRKHGVTWPLMTEHPDRREALAPNLVISGITAVVLVLCLFTVLCIFAPVGLDVRANTFVAPASQRPQWYLLFWGPLTRAVPHGWRTLVPLTAFVVLGALPFIDRTPAREPTKRVFALVLGAAVVVGILVLSYVGWAA